ncbi:kinesin light chain [Podospora aff. communis PSN243]|uniref:Kinesin light chain n=1 Tax=Podospora aff. communis PSN243 TaxID=3040156 RepID=A0AAV9GRQ1_9PEZI|nr:kinesin light chain [Podospora aff. communis PSN243]
MSSMQSVLFGAQNQGFQVGQNYGSISTQFHLLPEQPETPPQPFATIPFSRDPDFVERRDILEQIGRRCSEPASRVALVGLGGVGKSQLGIEFAHRIAEAQPDTWVFWVHAGTQARVEESFRTIADAVKLPGRNHPKANIPQLVHSWLSNERNGRWVMILDSADDRDVFYGTTSSDIRDGRPIATYLPQSRNGSIVVTTRNKDLAFRLTSRRQNMIDIGPMAYTDALTLLEKKLGSATDSDVAADLVQALDLVPLAISQAAAYIQARAPRSSPEKYLAEFRENERASNAILTTWEISFDYIRSKRPSAADLLSLMSFFDRQGIPGWVLKPSGTAKDTVQVGAEVGDGESDDSSSATDDNTDDGADDIDGRFEDDVAMLRDYCLITADDTGDEFEMHGLQDTFKRQYIERMAALFPTGKYENWAKCRGLFAHVQVALGYRFKKDTLEWATLLHNGGWYAWSQGRYEVAQQMVGKAMKVREKKLGREDVATLASASIFALVQKDQGKWEEAEKLNVQVMETRKTKLGTDHLDTMTSMNNLAFTWKSQGRYQEALALMEYCAQAQQRVIGTKHPYTLSSLAALEQWRSEGVSSSQSG